MASLTDTAYYARRAINWAILALIAYLILRFAWGIFMAVWLAVFPPKAPPPNHAFGRLPAVKFAAPLASPSGELSFRLETIEGGVPKASDSAAVFFMPKPAPNLLALTKTQEFAKKLGFVNDPIQESKNIYRFDDDQVPLRRMRYDIVTNNFLLRYLFELDTGIFIERNLPSANELKSEAKTILQTYKLYIDDLEQGSTTVSYLRLSGEKLVPTTSLSQADAVRIDFFRRAVNGIPVLTQIPAEAHVSFIFSGSNNSKKRILQFSYTFWPVDTQTLATYTLKPSTQAWDELQSGNGFIARYATSGPNVVVRKVYLAYLDTVDPQTYLQPIFVFEGDDGFLGYVAAVASQWTE